MPNPAPDQKAPEPQPDTKRRDSFIAKRRSDHQASHIQRLSRDYGRKIQQR